MNHIVLEWIDLKSSYAPIVEIESTYIICSIYNFSHGFVNVTVFCTKLTCFLSFNFNLILQRNVA